MLTTQDGFSSNYVDLPWRETGTRCNFKIGSNVFIRDFTSHGASLPLEALGKLKVNQLKM